MTDGEAGRSSAEPGGPALDPRTLLAALVDSSADAIVVCSPVGVILSWNRGADQLYGYPAADMIGRRVPPELIPDGRDDELDGRLARVLAGRDVEAFDTVRRTASGGRADMSVTMSPVMDDAGVVIAYITVARDISERKRAAIELAAADERFRSAFGGAPIGMVLCGEDGRFEQVNAAFCEIVGYTAEELRGLTFLAITHPDDAAETGAPFGPTLAGERATHTTEQRLVHRSGHPVHASMHSSVMREADGTPRGTLTQVQDITDRKRQEQELAYLADHDPLTGLLNRRAFNRALESHAQMAARYGAEGTVMVMDLDQFKFVNDTLGHQAGDELIVRASQLVASRLRATDVLARLGGDEFGVLLPKAGPSAAVRVAETLLEALRVEAIQIGGLDRTVSASIGIASFENEKGLSGEDVIVNADLAMYDAKEDGRDRAALYSNVGPDQARMHGRITWGHRIQNALATDGFALLAQPIMDLATRKVSQYELLLRMRDDHGDLIPPATFLYIAERLDLIGAVDKWVITNSLRELGAMNASDPGVAFEINISGSSLGDPKLLAHIEHELHETGVDPGRVIFEITETAALRGITRARAFADRLSRIGCRFALDDFGAGFSSFYYLKHLCFDIIKIDGEFVHHCRASDTDQLLIKAIVDIAAGMGKQTIAEFVGDDDTVDLLSRMGVDYGQGYHLGRPAALLSTHAGHRS